MDLSPRARLMLLLLAGLLAAGCTPRPAPAGTVAVVATIYPLAAFAERIGGERVTVRTLIPPGVAAHDYEPTPRDLVALGRARVFIYNGAGFEPWAQRVLAQLPAEVARVEATAGLPLVRTPRGVDPHVWLDPVLAGQQSERIERGMAGADPAGRGIYAANAAGWRADLAALDRAYREGLAGCRRKEFITAHAAFGYLARRYGLRLIAISDLAPEAEPSPARIRMIVEEARRAGVRVIFLEPRGERRVAEAIAREIGARLAVLNPLESLTAAEQQAGKNYLTVMYANRDELIRALDCR